MIKILGISFACFTSFLIGRNSSDNVDHKNVDPSDSAHSSRSSSVIQNSKDSRTHRSTDARSNTPSHSSEEDPISQVAKIIHKPNVAERTEAWLRFIKGLDPSQIEQVVESMTKMDNRSRFESEYLLLLTTWTNLDPFRALEYASKKIDSSNAQNSMLEAWGSNNPEDAFRWAQSQQKGDAYNKWLNGVIAGIAATNPQLSLQLIGEIPHIATRTIAISAVTATYIKQGIESARTWVESLENNEIRANAIVEVAQSQSRKDAQGTMDWLLANPGPGTDSAISRAMWNMTISDTNKAISYMDKIQDPATKRSALEGITGMLAGMDPQAALELIEANPSATSDLTYHKFVVGAHSSPQLASETALRIHNPQFKQRTVRYALDRWIRIDKNAAMQWAAQNNVPADWLPASK